VSTITLSQSYKLCLTQFSHFKLGLRQEKIIAIEQNEMFMFYSKKLKNCELYNKAKSLVPEFSQVFNISGLKKLSKCAKS